MEMRFATVDCEQRTPKWRAARAGRLTGSRADVLFMHGRKKSDESKARRDYIMQLVAERMNGEAQESLIWTADMQRGVDLEPLAFAMYEARTGSVVHRTGFLQMNDHMAGCSLDGHVGNFSRIIELKCPKLTTHLAYFEDVSTLEREYQQQIRHNLWVSGAPMCDLISFHNEAPQKMQLAQVRIAAGQAYIPEYEAAAVKFLAEVDAKFKVMERYA